MAVFISFQERKESGQDPIKGKMQIRQEWEESGASVQSIGRSGMSLENRGFVGHDGTWRAKR